MRVGDGDLRYHIGDPEQLGKLTGVNVRAGHISRMEPPEPLNAEARRLRLEPA